MCYEVIMCEIFLFLICKTLYEENLPFFLRSSYVAKGLKIDITTRIGISHPCHIHTQLILCFWIIAVPTEGATRNDLEKPNKLSVEGIERPRLTWSLSSTSQDWSSPTLQPRHFSHKDSCFLLVQPYFLLCYLKWENELNSFGHELQN